MQSLERMLPDAGGRLVLVSPSDYLSTLVLPLRRAGALKEIDVVLPFDNVLTPDHLTEIRAFLEKGGISEEDRASLAFDNGAIRGEIEGMRLSLRTLRGLPNVDGGRVVALDTSFLTAVFRNEVKTPMVDTAWRLVLTLRERGVSARRILILDTAGRADYPLEYGYLSALLREMLSAPETFTGVLPEKWRILKAAEGAYYFAQNEEAMALYREFLTRAPGDASACYKIAMMALRDLDVDMSLQWLNKAAAADPLYKRAYTEAAGYLYRKDLFDGAERILLAGLSKFPKEPVFATNLAAIYLSRGEALRRGGDEAGANEFFGMAAGVDGAKPQMRERARSLLTGPTAPPPK